MICFVAGRRFLLREKVKILFCRAVEWSLVEESDERMMGRQRRTLAKKSRPQKNGDV
jgi:hypothetical protein